MHTRRKEALFAFVGLWVLCCAFAAVTYVRPNMIFVSFLIVTVTMMFFAGYRVFCYTDDQYQAEDAKHQGWYARHPRLTALLLICGAVNFVWGMIKLIQDFMR